jgi:catechol 2,3-dioxygenase-like lactoylglutathione lyase family enzyme
METVSFVSAAVSVAGALASVVLAGVFEWRRRRSDRELARRDRMRRYREPLLQAAATLQARLGNAVRMLTDLPVTEVAPGSPRQEEYNRYESLYRFAAYQGWVHILFREVYFLDMGSRRRNRRLISLLVAVQGAIAGHDDHGRTGVLLGGEQRLVGELMVASEDTEEARLRCRGYADFRARLAADPEYARPFQPVLDFIDGLGEDTEGKIRRLVLVHNALIDLIDFLDRRKVWVEGPREKLEPEPSRGASMSVRRVVPDVQTDAMEENRDFYGVLGLETAMDLGWVVTLASPSNPTAQLILMTEDRSAPVTPDISVEVEDVDAVYAAVRERGAEIVVPLRDEEWGVRRFFVKDPDGRVVNVLAHR